MTFDRAYHRWNLAHAAVIVAAVGVVVFLEERDAPIRSVAVSSGALRVLAGWSAMALGVLYCASYWFGSSGVDHSSQRGHIIPDLLTAVRGTAAVALLWILPAAQQWSQSTVWIIGAILAVVEVTDFFDGRVARHYGPSSFGALWDMENDALFTLSLSLLVYTRYAVHPVLLLLGLMRYLYVLIWRFHRDPVTVSSAYKWFAKTTAAAIVVTLLVSVAPIIPGTLRVGALAVALTMQTISFGWDLVLQYQALRFSGPR